MKRSGSRTYVDLHNSDSEAEQCIIMGTINDEKPIEYKSTSRGTSPARHRSPAKTAPLPVLAPTRTVCKPVTVYESPTPTQPNPDVTLKVLKQIAKYHGSTNSYIKFQSVTLFVGVLCVCSILGYAAFFAHDKVVRYDPLVVSTLIDIDMFTRNYGQHNITRASYRILTSLNKLAIQLTNILSAGQAGVLLKWPIVPNLPPTIGMGQDDDNRDDWN